MSFNMLLELAYAKVKHFSSRSFLGYLFQLVIGVCCVSVGSYLYTFISSGVSFVFGTLYFGVRTPL